MKKRSIKYIAMFLLIVMTAGLYTPTIIAQTPAAAPAIPYVTDGLEALYVGCNNTGIGQDKAATTWKDLSGKGNDITGMISNATNYFSDYGYVIDSIKTNIPDALAGIVNGTEYTVEVVIGDFTPKGNDYNTLLNSVNDSFSLFRLKSADQLIFKCAPNAKPDRPTVADGENLIKNSTITITGKVGSKVTMYVDGVQVAQNNLGAAMTADKMFFGWDGTSKNYAATYLGMRFYSKELTADQVAANSKVDSKIKTITTTPYVTDGIEALYVGCKNTGTAQDKAATTWKDLSGKNNDITGMTKDDKNCFVDTGYMFDSIKTNLPAALTNIVNGNEYSVEIEIGDFIARGTAYNTLMNSVGDHFALFRRVSDNVLAFKCAPNTSDKRPVAANGDTLIKDSTITITGKVGGKVTMYVNGVQVAQNDLAKVMEAAQMFFGWDGTEKNFAAIYKGIRFYSKELTAAQVADNYLSDKIISFLAGKVDKIPVPEEPVVLDNARSSGAIAGNATEKLVSVGKTYQIIADASAIRTDGYKVTDTALTDGTLANGVTGSAFGINAKTAEFIVDLGAIDYKLFKFRADLIGDSTWGIADPKSVTVSISEDGNTYYSAGSSTTLTDHFFTVQLDNTVSARYVKFSCEAGSHVWLSEIEVYESILPNAASTGAIAAEAQKNLVSAGKSYQIVYYPDYKENGGARTDGYKIDNVVLTDGTKHAADDVGGGFGIDAPRADFILDLGAVNANLYKFGADLVGGAWGIAQPTGIIVSVSEDGNTYYNVGTSITKTDTFFVVELDHTVSARYIKFECDAGSHVWLSEIEAYEAVAAAEESTDTSADTSADASTDASADTSSDVTPPDTGDATTLFVVIAMVMAGAASLVIKKRKA